METKRFIADARSVRTAIDRELHGITLLVLDHFFEVILGERQQPQSS